ncbi:MULTISPECIES: hypothetical protein [unclassified Pseudodesulfovibrio]|uniref:hypothetical protein n=1 Tax=unclassified Pseudodesulfovibrio TaxID=2661612 RepID=UPI000FEC19C4|nr:MULTISPECIES: hypothetical protein [unclassified Pseudodesulfovibrio]MCJ2163370.1 hypothetical protein [Pseudodesulfovibrio sp. S3-i]RWU06609.1 hypothetical protein DWB63_02275 [Pseudodesulfovibrio sp. S3]
MKIEWTIQKKRGNHRPVLNYSIELEQFEIDLVVPQVVLESAIARPPSAWRSFCYPDQDERAGAGLDWYRLMTPSHSMKRFSESLTLPWRAPDSEFLDIKMAFERLRADFELILKNAHDSAPLDVVENLELTQGTRKHIATGVVSARFLSAVGF